jgi:hypothetical protein
VSAVELAAILSATVVVASMISVEVGISVALIELSLGIALGNTFSVETGLSTTRVGKLIMSACFV